MKGSQLRTLFAFALAACSGTGARQVESIVTGSDHTCILITDGTVRCWGRDRYGELGDGIGAKEMCDNDPCSLRAVDVQGLADVRILASGPTAHHTCAIDGAGDLWCWGYNSKGGLGDGTTQDRDSPVRVDLAGPVDSVAPGFEHTCALAGGRVWCWGTNFYGELGDGTRESSHSPVEALIPGGTVVALAAGAFHTCAVLQDGSVWCWGGNQWGQLGDGLSQHAADCNETLADWQDCSPEPVAVAGVGGAARVSIEHAYSCAAGADGVTCWGNAPQGGTRPTFPASAGSIVDVAAGDGVVCARSDTGRVFCWGSSFDGHLGVPDVITSDVPLEVALGGPAQVLATGEDHSCTLLESGDVVCWGRNDVGQLGDGTALERDTPVHVSW